MTHGIEAMAMRRGNWEATGIRHGDHWHMELRERRRWFWRLMDSGIVRTHSQALLWVYRALGYDRMTLEQSPEHDTTVQVYCHKW